MLIPLAILFILLVAWFANELLGSYDSSSDTALRTRAVEKYESGRADHHFRPLAPSMRNPGAGDHFRDGAIFMRSLMADDIDGKTLERTQRSCVKSFSRALRCLYDRENDNLREFTRPFVLGKISQARMVLLDDEVASGLDAWLKKLNERQENSKPHPDPFNVADARVIDHTGRCVRLLLSASRFELARRGTRPSCFEAAAKLAQDNGFKKALWGLETMARFPARLPLGADGGTTDADVFVAGWLWSDRSCFLQMDVGHNLKESLLSALEDVVTDKMEWELGALCRCAHLVGALAGAGDEDDDALANGATTFQIS